jgi:hypothetical protein
MQHLLVPEHPKNKKNLPYNHSSLLDILQAYHQQAWRE